MNSRKKAKKAQKKRRFVITSQHGQALWRGAALQFFSSLSGWQQAARVNGSSGRHLRILTYVPTQQRCVSIVSIFASFAPFCGY
jgi:hypothetical protein